MSPMAGTAYESVDSAMTEDDDTADINEIQNTDSEGIVPEFVDRTTEESKEELKEESQDKVEEDDGVLSAPVSAPLYLGDYVEKDQEEFPEFAMGDEAEEDVVLKG